jgi:GMP synthase (glutamine-hydrolysing)
MIAVLHHLEPPFLGHAAAALAGVALDERFAGDPLPDLDTVDGIVSLGGSESAWDASLAGEAELLRAAVVRGVPVLGICLGAQLLAYAHGGAVSRLPRRLIAWPAIEALPAAAGDPVLGALPTGAAALHWNEDGLEPPPGAVELLASPAGGRAEGFRLGPSAWGVQFHPEVDGAALDRWYGAWGDLLGPAGVTEAGARAADARHLGAQAALAEAIFGGFAHVVRDRAATHA